MSDSELLRLACVYAEQDREAFLQAYERMPNDPEAKKAAALLKRLRAYRLKRWGKTAHEEALGHMKEVGLSKAAKKGAQS